MRYLSPISKILFMMTAVVVSASADPVLQVPNPGQWRGSVSAGIENDIDSNLLDSGTVSLSRVNAPATPVTATVEGVTFNDVYGSTLTTGVEAAYAVTRFSEIFGRLSYTTASGDTMTLGSANGSPLLAEFDDYNSYGLDFGYRYFVELNNTLFTPYIGGVAGLRYVPSFGAKLTSGSDNFGDITLFDDSITPTFGLDLGFLYPITRDIAVGFETGVYYSMKLNETDSGFSNKSSEINDSASRFYIPAKVKGTVKF